MKKYLIKGALALFTGAFLFSCADKETEFVPVAQQKVKAFEDVFKEVYGDIDPYQDWGFSSGKVVIDPNDSSIVVEVVDVDADVAFTRALAFEGYGVSGTRGHNANGNEWYKKYTVPYALTEHQKDIVRQYFQQVKDPGELTLNFKDFFVQDVYKGGTNTTDALTTEYHTAANGDTFYGSNKMNKLTSAGKGGSGNEHINNYNNAQCSSRDDIKHAGVYNDDYNPWTEENYDEDKGWENCVTENENNLKEFSDKIMLMEDCSTAYFGYENSLQSSYTYNDMFACVLGETIMTWARENNKTIYNDGDVSGMYFVGFDYEADLKHGHTDIGQSNSYLVTEVPAGTPGAFQVPNKGDGKWYIDGARDHFYSDWIVRIVPGRPETQPVYRDVVTSTDTWTQLERGRVFCEDLGQSSREDLDYNDVVFDAIIFQNHTFYKKEKVAYLNGVETSRTVVEGPTEAWKYFANINLLAAGGTIPITVQGYPVHDQFNDPASTAVETMVNTRDYNSTAFGSYAERKAAQIGSFSKTFEADFNENGVKEQFNVKLIEMPEDAHAISDIKIWSYFKDSQVTELNGEKGGAPHKFMAPMNTKWTSERKNISLAYPDFDSWVKDKTKTPWGNVNPNYIYTANTDLGRQLPLVMKARTTIETEGMSALWTGLQKYESSWSLARLNTTLDVDKFYPGDRLRFYGTDIKDEAWITVIVADVKPYFIDSNFPNFIVDSNGNQIPKESGCVEVMLDEKSAEILNNAISGGTLNMEVQGRNFILTRICRVLFQ